jgi:chloramphenicol-sensitive protein RarD
MSEGVWYAVCAYVCWGLFPIYWKQLDQVPALQLIGHRILWSFVMLAAIIGTTRQWQAFRRASFNTSVLRVYTVAAALVTVNWFTFVWAVNSGYVIETSLGYFINPLVNVLFGVLFLHERLRPVQWIAIGLAAAGVLYLTILYGSLPWIALVLALSFGSYGLVKKKGLLGSVHGLALETAILTPLAIAYLMYVGLRGNGALLHEGLRSDLLLLGTGAVTTIPLLFFASAVRRIPLSLLGVLQYIAPTMQFLLGVLLYREPFTSAQFVGFAMVWAALIVLGVEGFRIRSGQREAPVNRTSYGS